MAEPNLAHGLTHEQFPVQVSAELDGQPQTICCDAQLRLLPGKRAVYRATAFERQVIIKAFFGHARKKYLEREIAGLQALQTAKLPTPAILARGALRDTQADILVLEYLENSTSLGQLLDNESLPGIGLSLLRPAITTIAKMHDCGIVQQDIHPENFLLRDGLCYVIDGGSIETGTAYLENLALFCAQIALVDEALVTQLFDVYYQQRKAGCTFSARALWRATERKQQQRTRKFLKKIYRDCTQVKVEKNWRRLIASTGSFESAGLTALLANPDVFIKNAKLLKDGNSSTVALVKLDGASYVVKRYNLKNVWHKLSRCLRESRASISWRNANLLTLLGIDTPRPIALLEKRAGWLHSTSYFICEHIEADDLRSLFAGPELPSARRAKISTNLTALLEKLRAAKISHGDFKATNFLVTENRIVLIDLDAMHWHQSLKRFDAARTKDLTRFMANWDKNPTAFAYFSELISAAK